MNKKCGRWTSAATDRTHNKRHYSEHRISSVQSRSCILYKWFIHTNTHTLFFPQHTGVLFFYIFLIFFICSEFCHTLKWNSHGITCVPHPDPPSHLPLHLIPLGLPSTLVSCIQPGLVICFTLDNVHVSMLFSWTIPPSPSPTV